MVPMARAVLEAASERRLNWIDGRITWNVFPDGTPNLFVEDIDNIRGKDVVFLASFHDPAAIFSQLAGMTRDRYN
jgi:hypothetical protein